MECDGKFYIGREYDSKAKKTLKKPILYDPDDLTTHGVVVGMTGSGKTGLCINILEEAALNGIPALIVDPKGDITNLLLHFPALASEDFLEWVDADQARREGKSANELATEVAGMWKKGLEKWDISTERIAQVRDGVDYAIYTPGFGRGLSGEYINFARGSPNPLGGESRALTRKDFRHCYRSVGIGGG